MAYETWNARGGEGAPLKAPRREAAPATSDQLEILFADWHRALWAIDFFKTRRSENVMRSFREIVFRAALDGREAALIRAMGIEVSRYLERVGAPFAGRPPVTGAPGEAP
jgi:tRNA C32,U32 (ribose-2'-O)-methylase TrmJ